MQNNLVDLGKDFLLELNKRIGTLLKLGSVGISTAVGFPVVGSIFNILYSDTVGGMERKNFQQFMIGYVNKKIDEKFDEHDEKQVEIVKHAILSSLRCSHEAKIERILEILSSSLDKSLPIAEAEDLMNLVVELSENEAIVFREVYDNFSDNHTKFSVRNIIEYLPNYNDNIDFYLNRLVGKGLLQEDTGAIYRQDGKMYRHTTIGWQLFEAFHVKNDM